MSWFANWFDSPYYHTLYKNRDEKEAQVFIDNLVQHLQSPKGSTLIDIACGKGRHATYFNSLGLDVVGVDLSPNSIASATKNAGDKNGDLGKIAGTVYQIFSTKADLRTWTSLPKSFAVTRIETPKNRKLTLLVGSQKSEIIVNAGKVSVVYVKGFADSAPLKIHQFKLK